MIVSEILGGLGNQMFQYAVGLSLATKLNTDFRLDKTKFKGYKAHKFGLDTLRLSIDFMDPADYFLLERSNSATRNIKEFVKSKKSNKPAVKVYRERGFAYAPEVLSMKGDVYLTGYFQSEKYFLSIRDSLLTAFKPKKVSKDARAMAEKIIKEKKSVSLHVRRGDYVSNPDANKYHGTKSVDYYNAALLRVEKSQKDSTVFVFSDDIEWCKKNLKLVTKQIVWVDSENSAIEDIYLMSLCKSNIIANSTFSWWGAWLNNNPKKIVVAPKVWFSDPKIDTSDLIPGSWVRL